MGNYSVIKCTSKGGRDYNQDCCDFIIDDNQAVLALADGLGGHSGGEIASKLAISAVLDGFSNKLSSTNLIEEIINDAQQAVVKAQQENSDHSQMRTTLVVCAIKEKTAYIGYIGDSRLYIFRDDKILFQTTDHSLVQLYVGLGEIEKEEIRTHPDKSVLRRVIGDEEKFKPEITSPIKLLSDDMLLLCTDGFWEYVTEEKMLMLKGRSKSKELWLNAMINEIKQIAKLGHDNYSAILMKVR